MPCGLSVLLTVFQRDGYMKKSLIVSFCAMLMLGCASTDAPTETKVLPYFSSESGTKSLIVDDAPFLMFAGELHNSTAGSAHKLEKVWPEMASLSLNTLLLPVSWELIEPEEGVFDFTVVDSMIKNAREHDLKLVLLWFGSWKNGKSTYVPAWVKEDPKRFPLAINQNGSKNSALSAFYEANLNADAKAFSKLMRHLHSVDRSEQTVLMVQVENELGLLGTHRDFSEKASSLYAQQVPDALIQYLNKHKNSLHVAIKNAWQENGFRQSGSWQEVFGPSELQKETDWKSHYSYLAEEIFTAWHYASYVGEIARKGKQQYALPMFANAWQKQPRAKHPGNYPSGGPLPHLSDIWRAAAPSIDFIAPDIYELNEFDWIAQSYLDTNNPLFIPEIKVGPNTAARAFYTFGKYHAIGYSPFGIDGEGLFNTRKTDDRTLQPVYENLTALAPKISAARGTNNLTGLFFDEGENSASVDLGDWEVGIKRFSSQGLFKMTGGLFGIEGEADTAAGGLLVLRESKNQFLVVGGIGGLQVSVSKGSTSPYDKVGYAEVDEITFVEGKELSHRLNGDEMALGGPPIQPGEVKIFRIKMYGNND